MVWYPAQTGGTPVSYLEYVRSRVTEEAFDLTEKEVSELLALTLKAISVRLGADQAREELNSRMLAVLDAKPLSGQFPVVIYAAGGYGSADENADMCEYLASHGYVVIASPSMGAHTKGISIGLEDVEAQVGDIEFLIGYAKSLPQSDMAHLAVVGWSWGGMSNVFAAAKDSRITALVSFDGTREPPLTKLIAPPRISLPWMYVSRTPDTIPQLNRKGIDTSFSLLNEAKYADLYMLTMYPMTHLDFTSKRRRQSLDSDFTEYTNVEVSRAYNWVVRYVHQFLNAYLKQDAGGLAFINNTPAKNAVPQHMMVAEIRRADDLPLGRESFAAELATRGFGRALEVYQETQKRSSNFKLSEEELKNWGYALLARNLCHEAIEIFSLWARLFPGNWDASDSLAEAYEQNKDTTLAIKYYQRSLDLNPKNDNGRQHLKVLQAAAATR